MRSTDASERQIAPNKTVQNYITKDISSALSFATTEATDYYEQETTPYNRLYYVLDGTLLVIVDGEEISLGVGDVCYLEKDTTYEMKGTFKAIIVNQPAFGT